MVVEAEVVVRLQEVPILPHHPQVTVAQQHHLHPTGIVTQQQKQHTPHTTPITMPQIRKRMLHCTSIIYHQIITTLQGIILPLI